MAYAMTSIAKKQVCSLCAPKETFAILSCKGCSTDFCRKHFNEHRDTLSNDLNKLFHRHDRLLEELQTKIDHSSNLSNNENARVILKQINEWETTATQRVSQVAREARAKLERLFDRKLEYAQLNQRLSEARQAMQEQQNEENFVENHINHWIKQLEQLKTDLNRPSQAERTPPTIQIQNIDWNNIVKISAMPDNNKHSTHLT